MQSYQSESQALDAGILGIIERWQHFGEPFGEVAFNDLALRLFDYQLRYNEPYARYCRRLGVTSPQSWEEIPAVPAAAFKEGTLTTFDPAAAALVFETSGTTRDTPGRHYMETTALYDAALLAGFDRFVISNGARLRYFNLVPNPAERPHSSLGYMMARVAGTRGDERFGWYLRGDELLVDEFVTDLRDAIAETQPVCIAATAFALVHLLDELDRRTIRFTLPEGSRIMETGGFKGRSRVVDRDALYEQVCERFDLPRARIVAEYGMTELSSQYYSDGGRAYTGPPWLRARVVGPERTTLPDRTIGALLHVDLGNRSSCIAVQTDDLGAWSGDGLVLFGRDRDAALRGCSLDAEELRARIGSTSAQRPTSNAS